MGRDKIFDLLPPEEVLNEYDASDLALRIAPELLSRWQERKQPLCLHNLTLSEDPESNSVIAMCEAIAWLMREGLLVPAPGSQAGWYVPSRRMQLLRTEVDFEAFHKVSLLPKALLHPSVAGHSYSDFVRGDYEGAVFKAFKELEVTIREAANLPDSEIGVSLARKAFDKENGPLTDLNQPSAEREAMAHLFAGAIGSAKNPSSHRRVAVDAENAVELLMMASYLLKIVDSRRC